MRSPNGAQQIFKCQEVNFEFEIDILWSVS